MIRARAHQLSEIEFPYDCIDWIIKNTLLPDLVLHTLNYSAKQLQYLKCNSSEIYSSRSVEIIFIFYLRSYAYF
jgi:hypothetical protein